MGYLVLVPGMFASWAVCYAFSIRTSRELERQGWFRTKTSIQVVSVPLFVAGIGAGIGLAALVFAALHLPGDRLVDGVLADVLMVGSMFLVGAASVVLARRLPAPARSGPRASLNDAASRRLRQAGRWSSALMLLPVPYWFLGYGLLTELVVVVVTVLAALWLRGLLLRASERLATQDVLALRGTPLILYVRPFDDESRLFAADRTFEQFFAERSKSAGQLVALGYPGDRIAPAGAIRSYYSDEEWKPAFERLAGSARYIVGVVASSTNTMWELGQIRDLGRHPRLYLFTTPSGEVDAESAEVSGSNQTVELLRRVGRFCNAWISSDMAFFTQLLSFGAPPVSSQPVAQASWADFSQILNSLGYAVETNDPGPGSVLGFDAEGRMQVLATGVRDAQEYVSVMVDADQSSLEGMHHTPAEHKPLDAVQHENTATLPSSTDLIRPSQIRDLRQ